MKLSARPASWLWIGFHKPFVINAPALDILRDIVAAGRRNQLADKRISSGGIVSITVIQRVIDGRTHEIRVLFTLIFRDGIIRQLFGF